MKTTSIVALLCASLSLSGCGSKTKCASGTLQLDVEYGSLPAGVTVMLTLSKGGVTQTTATETLTRAGDVDHTDVQISVGANDAVHVDAVATANGSVVGHGSADVTLGKTCTSAQLTFAALDDLGAGMPDLPGLDASPGDDLAGFVFPSNVNVGYLDASTVDWVVTSNTTIDTSQLTNAISPAPPAGVVYAYDGQVAVVAVHSLTIAGGVTMNVIGTTPLAIVAGDRIVVNGVLDASAHGTVSGPGGAAPGAGTGQGGAGFDMNFMVYIDSGGGGAGFGSAGGAGGDVPSAASGGTAGVTYGSDTVAVEAGSGGGQAGVDTCSAGARGGAGGGFLQLSARNKVTLASFQTSGGVNGVIAVAGGAGSSCGGTGGGGGGGSGGKLVVEAPSVSIAGLLSAAGGGGGSTHTPGNDGLSISALSTSSLGAPADLAHSNSGGAGANEITATSTAMGGGPGVAGDMVKSGPWGAGGGGGGAGRIHVRSSGTPQLGQITPQATIDPTLPAQLP